MVIAFSSHAYKGTLHVKEKYGQLGLLLQKCRGWVQCQCQCGSRSVWLAGDATLIIRNCFICLLMDKYINYRN